MNQISLEFKSWKQQNKKLYLFGLRFISLLLGWMVFYRLIWNIDSWMYTYQLVSEQVIQFILYSTSLMLYLFGYDTEIVAAEHLVKIKNTIGVCVGEPCIGYNLMVFFCRNHYCISSSY